jgi:3-hydroxybutyrate dehydrogenase
MSSGLPDAPHVLITGTSGAIGGAVARLLRARRPKARLSLVDRDAVPSEQLASATGGHSFPADLGDVAAIPDLVRRIEDAQGPLDGLVSCAGIMDVGRFESFGWERAWKMLAVDLVAPLRLMQLCIPGMLARRSGFIVNVTSMAGRVPLKGCGYYGAAKAGLSMASEIAHGELARRGVHVATVYPGPVASALERGARAQFGNAPMAEALPTGRPDRLAARILAAIEHRKPRVVYPPLYEIGWYAVALASRVTLALGPEPIV